jgi:hypothetical protein
MPNRPTSKDVYELLMEVKIEQAVQHEKTDQILAEAKKTNGRVSTLEDWAGGIKMWTIKAIAIALIMTSWIWIKESRDFAFKLLGIVS